MSGRKELDKARDDAALDDPLDGRVLLLGEQLAELGRRVELGVGRVGEDGLHHLGQVGELERTRRQAAAGQRRARKGSAEPNQASRWQSLKKRTHSSLAAGRSTGSILVRVGVLVASEVAALGDRVLTLDRSKDEQSEVRMGPSLSEERGKRGRRGGEERKSGKKRG